MTSILAGTLSCAGATSFALVINPGGVFAIESGSSVFGPSDAESNIISIQTVLAGGLTITRKYLAAYLPPPPPPPGDSLEDNNDNNLEDNNNNNLFEAAS